jgi:hypothetical protein
LACKRGVGVGHLFLHGLQLDLRDGICVLFTTLRDHEASPKIGLRIGPRFI